MNNNFDLTNTEQAIDLELAGIAGPLLIKDNRLLVLFVEQVLLTFDNCCKIKGKLQIDGCNVLLRSFDHNNIANLIPSYQKGHKRQFNQDEFDHTLSQTDFYILINANGLSIELTPLLVSELHGRKEIHLGDTFKKAA